MKYPHLKYVLPSMGYSLQQLSDLGSDDKRRALRYRRLGDTRGFITTYKNGKTDNQGEVWDSGEGKTDVQFHNEEIPARR